MTSSIHCHSFSEGAYGPAVSSFMAVNKSEHSRCEDNRDKVVITFFFVSWAVTFTVGWIDVTHVLFSLAITSIIQ